MAGWGFGAGSGETIDRRVDRASFVANSRSRAVELITTRELGSQKRYSHQCERLLARRSAVLARAIDKTAFFFGFFVITAITKLGEVPVLSGHFLGAARNIGRRGSRKRLSSCTSWPALVVARMNLIKGAISGDERRHPSGGEDELGRHQRSSEVFRGLPRSSEDVLGRDALHGLGDCEGFDRRGERTALREHMWRGVTKPIEAVLALRVIGWVMSAPDEACNRASPHECAATRRRLAPASAVVCFCGIVTGSAGVSSRGAHGFHQWPSSEAIIHNQKQSVAIRGHQRPSEAIRGNQWPSEAIRGHQRHSYLRCRHGRPRLMYLRAGLGALWQRPCLLAFDTQLEAIRGN